MKRPARCSKNEPNFVVILLHVPNIINNKRCGGIQKQPNPHWKLPRNSGCIWVGSAICYNQKRQTTVGEAKESSQSNTVDLLANHPLGSKAEYYCVKNKSIHDHRFVSNRFFGRKFGFSDENQVSALRKSILQYRTVEMLTNLCGCICQLRKRADECLNYIRMAARAHDLTHEELYSPLFHEFNKEEKAENVHCLTIKASKLEVSKAGVPLFLWKSDASVREFLGNLGLIQVIVPCSW